MLISLCCLEQCGTGDIVVMIMALSLIKFLLVFKLYMLIGHRPEGGRSFHDEPIMVIAVLLDICRMSLP
jgi:hypothetical protein